MYVIIIHTFVKKEKEKKKKMITANKAVARDASHLVHLGLGLLQTPVAGSSSFWTGG